ncbi:MAG: hypothetical protein HYT41_00430 [Candidatus Sungbacteria bacterium]|nr:hypothetical protein [Candidatus Sungbacteria bacterium]
MYGWYVEHPRQEPTREDIARKIGISVERYEELAACLQFYDVDSLDRGVGDASDGERSTLGDFIRDPQGSPEDIVIDAEHQEKLREFVGRLLRESTMAPIDRECIVLWCGLEGNRAHSLEEIGGRFGVTRERVRQRIAMEFDALRTPELWEEAAQYTGWIAQPGKTRKTDTKIGDTMQDRIAHVRRAPEDIAIELLNKVALAHEVDGKALRRGGVLPERLREIRRYALEAIYVHAKLSDAFVARFFNMDIVAMEEELAALYLERTREEGKRQIKDDFSRRLDVMKILLQAAEADGYKPEQLYGSGELSVAPALMHARQTAIGRLHKELGLSFLEIAQVLHMQDASYVMDIVLSQVKEWGRKEKSSSK